MEAHIIQAHYTLITYYFIIYFMQINKCRHILDEHDQNCKICGVYIFKMLRIHGTKTVRFNDCNLLKPVQYLQQLRQNASKIQKIKQAVINRDGLNTIDSVLAKFNFSQRCYALAIYIFYSIYSGNNQVFKSNALKYLTMSVFLAAKIIQYTSCPPLVKFRKHANKIFQIEEYVVFQEQTMREMNYDFETMTFIDFLYFYMCNGVVFTNESIKVLQVQNNILKLINQYLTNHQFIKQNQQHLACYILHKCRSQTNVTEVWNWCIEQFTKVNITQIKQIVKHFENKQNKIRKKIVSFK